jgi:cadmium resistance protein CadD (predicted permease)
MDFLSLVWLGIAVFVATDIDDLFVLMLFFSSSNYKAHQVILGQYLGIGLLVVVGAIGSLIALVVPPIVVGLMGLLPIAIGVKKLLELRRKNAEEQEDGEIPQKNLQQNNGNRASRLSFLTVAGVTVANGGDNIAVYVPLFASSSTLSESIVLVAIFLVTTAAWCAIAYYLVDHRFIATRISRIGHILLPFVLIGLGIYILAEAFIVL